MKKKKLLVLTLLATFCVHVSFQSVLATEKNGHAYRSRVRVS